MEVTMIDPKTLRESDPNRHTMKVRARLTELAEHLREDVQKVNDPASRRCSRPQPKCSPAWKKPLQAMKKRRESPGNNKTSSGRAESISLDRSGSSHTCIERLLAECRGVAEPIKGQIMTERIISTSVLVIGTWGGGLRAAIELRQQGLDVLAVGKRRKHDAHKTLAAGGTNAALGRMDPQDSWQQHAADTIKESYDLADPRIVEIMPKNAPEGIRELEAWGMPFAREAAGRISQRYFGAYGFDIVDGSRVIIHADAVILATGGHTRIWRQTTSRRDENTGDTFRLAALAGALLRDAELVQFHPSGIMEPADAAGMLISEAARGEGGILRNALAERFMSRYDPERMELSPRDRVALAISTEISDAARRGAVCCWIRLTWTAT
jgi:succinate dehydrogenase/fumarate reductase flavoprotein subunit